MSNEVDTIEAVQNIRHVAQTDYGIDVNVHVWGGEEQNHYKVYTWVDGNKFQFEVSSRETYPDETIAFEDQFEDRMDEMAATILQGVTNSERQ